MHTNEKSKRYFHPYVIYAGQHTVGITISTVQKKEKISLSAIFIGKVLRKSRLFQTRQLFLLQKEIALLAFQKLTVNLFSCR